ncbi:MAG: [ribosomal protein S5]-alanine N-acetyltransferase [Actinomycetota bacterium]|nr:[ribosomal protein S5]-alanine N-acetyltransferase [Actinomycetota bacterium]
MIVTERLTLYALSPPLVALLAAADWDAARATEPPYDISDETFSDDEHVLLLRLAQLAKDPDEEPWLMRVAVLKGTRQVVGRVGFHQPPDAEGVVEVGYSVTARFRRQGFAVEMAEGLIAWAASRGCSACLASVRPDNAPSLATIEKLGFVKVGEQMDEIDGLEWVHRLELGTPKARSRSLQSTD